MRDTETITARPCGASDRSAVFQKIDVAAEPAGGLDIRASDEARTGAGVTLRVDEVLTIAGS